MKAILRSGFLALAIVLALSTAFAIAQGADPVPHAQTGDSPEGQWLIFTRPMVACYVMDNDEYERQRVQIWSALQAWAEGRDLPARCTVIEPGTEMQLAAKQPTGAIHLMEWCIGCAPYLVAYFTPTRKIAGDFLKPTQMPKVIRDYFILGIGPFKEDSGISREKTMKELVLIALLGGGDLSCPSDIYLSKGQISGEDWSCQMTTYKSATCQHANENQPYFVTVDFTEQDGKLIILFDDKMAGICG